MLDHSAIPRGFSGLSSLLSDRETELKRAAQSAIEQVKVAEPAPSAVAPVPVSKVPGSGKSSHSWVLMLGVIAVFGIIAIGNSKTQPPSAPSFTPSPPAPFFASTPPEYSPQITSSLPTAFTTTVAPAYSPPPPTESMPAVGQNLVLTAAEIRYCLSSKIRIEGAQSVLDNTSQLQVDQFNSLVDDYNSRCSSYRYSRSVMNQVVTEVEALRSNLFAEGRRLMR